MTMIPLQKILENIIMTDGLLHDRYDFTNSYYKQEMSLNKDTNYQI